MEFPVEMYPDADVNNREQILQQIFGDVGELQFDFSCAVETTMLLHGRMYTTNKFLCFYSNLFGVEKKIRIPFSHITTITKENTALVIPNAIAITTNRKEYLFRSFWDRDECFRILQELTEKYKAAAGKGEGDSVPVEGSGGEESVTASPAPHQQHQNQHQQHQHQHQHQHHHTFSPIIMGSKSLSETPMDLRSILARRSQAAATAASPLSPADIAPPTALSLQQRQQVYAQRLGQQQQQQTRSRTPSNASNNSVFSSSTVDVGYSPAGPYASPNHHQYHHSYPDSATVPHTAVAAAAAHHEGAAEAGIATIQRLTDDAYPSTPESSSVRPSAAPIQGEAAVVGSSSSSSSSSGVALQLAQEAQEEQHRLYHAEVLASAFRDEHRRSLLKERVILNEVLPVSAQQFLDLFYEDDALFSMKRYHEGTKDRNVLLSPWAPSQTGREAPGVMSSMREMRFMKHITNVLAGVRESRAIKVFQLKKFGDVGAVVMSSTRCEDIPAGSTFSVEDSVVLRNVGPNRVSVDMSFECKFIARTILKMAIESNTASDMRRWVRGFFDRLKAHCVHYANEHPYMPPSVTTATLPPPGEEERQSPPPPPMSPLSPLSPSESNQTTAHAGDGVDAAASRKALRKKSLKTAVASAAAPAPAVASAALGAPAPLTSSTSPSVTSHKDGSAGEHMANGNGKTADEPSAAIKTANQASKASAVGSPAVKTKKELASAAAAAEQPVLLSPQPAPPIAPPADDPVKPPSEDASKPPSARSAVKPAAPVTDTPLPVGSWAFAAYVAGFSVCVVFFMAYALEKMAALAEQYERMEKTLTGGGGKR